MYEASSEHLGVTAPYKSSFGVEELSSEEFMNAVSWLFNNVRRIRWYVS
jgi:hypothetical protein